MPGLVAPNEYPIRDPRDDNQTNGRTENPPRYYQIGSMKGRWPGKGFKVERATSVRASHSSTGKNKE